VSGDAVAGLLVVGLLVAGALVILAANEGQRARTAAASTALYDGAAADATPLVAHAYGLTGRPALVTRAADGSVTVVLARSGAAPATAAPPDALQLAAEALVAEEALGVSVARGVLRYPARDLALPITPALRELVTRQLADLRANEAAGPRLHRQDPTVCRACAYRAMCAIGRVNAPAPHSAMG
jgi:hypothetical protein